MKIARAKSKPSMPAGSKNTEQWSFFFKNNVAILCESAGYVENFGQTRIYCLWYGNKIVSFDTD